MITNPTSGAWCRFNFGGADYSVGDCGGAMCVPAVLIDAFVKRLRNNIPVCITFDDEGEGTTLIEGENERWFVIRDHFSAENRFEVTEVNDRSVIDCAQELIADLEGGMELWESHWGFDGDSAENRILELRNAIAFKQKAMRDEERMIRERMLLQTSAQRDEANRKQEATRKAYDEFERSSRGRKMAARSRSLNWDDRNYLMGFIGNGWCSFVIGGIDFTFSSCAGMSPADLLWVFRQRVERKGRLYLHLDGEGPEFWFVETNRGRYGIWRQQGKSGCHVKDLSDVSLHKMSVQLMRDAEFDVYAWCHESYGGCSRECESQFRGGIGLLKRAINKRWPKRSRVVEDSDWRM